MIRISLLFFIISLSSILMVEAQQEYIVNQTKFIQKVNPSAFGMNQLNRIGVLFNTLKINENSVLDNRYVFGTIAFQEKNFSLGFDVNQFKMNDIGLTSNAINVSYVYKIQMGGYSFLLPAITGGWVSSAIDIDGLIFGDQLDATTGFIQALTNDLLAPQISNMSYPDLGASLIYHSDIFMLGLSIKHLNKPNASFNQEDKKNVKPLRIAVQGGYEFDLNPFENRFLPRSSYMFAYMNFVKYGDAMYMSLAQDFQLGEFSVGFTQQMGSVNSFALNNFGFTLGAAMENFDFGIHYNFPSRKPGAVFSPSMFELSVIFDFSIFRRNNRGLYKRLQIDNYY